MRRVFPLMMIFGSLVAVAFAGGKVNRLWSPDRYQTADTNGDGLLSKEEFMMYQESVWRYLRKTPEGLVDLDSIETPAPSQRPRT
jgi:hypothetical protein